MSETVNCSICNGAVSRKPYSFSDGSEGWMYFEMIVSTGIDRIAHVRCTEDADAILDADLIE